MTWTYSGDPTSTPVDEVRFLMQDINPNRQLLQNEEIDYVLSITNPIYGSPIMAAAYGLDLVSGRFAANVAISADGVSVQMQNLMSQFEARAEALREQYTRLQGAGAVPYVGGIQRFEIPDFMISSPQFGVGMDDNAWAGRQNYGRRGDTLENWPYEESSW